MTDPDTTAGISGSGTAPATSGTTAMQPAGGQAPAATSPATRAGGAAKPEAESRKPALLAHFPSFRWRDAPLTPGKDPILYAPFPEELRERYKDDLAVLEDYVLKAYVEEDREALRAQNEYRRDQVVLIIGGVIATGLAAVPGEFDWEGWKVIAAIFAAFLAAWAGRSRDLNAQERWRTSRLKAELLRGEYFLFLGRAEPYHVEGCRTRNLRKRVAEIRSGGAA